jgi:predicted CoA-binding protein
VTPEDLLRDIFEKHKTIAVYGMSNNVEKASHKVPSFLLSKGYNIIPVNPRADTVMNRKSYPNLESIPENIEILDVFRPSDQVLDVVKEAVARKKQRGDIDVIWLQLDIKNEEAKKIAEEAGITFVQNRCMMREFKRIFNERREE